MWAQRGDRLFLAARDEQQLQAMAADLATRGGQPVGTQVFDANHLDQHAALLQGATQAMGGIDVVLIAHGTLTDQARAEQDVRYALAEIGTNGVSVVSLMTLVAHQLEAQGHGTLAVISSVAGDRGRQSNYVYGSAKALVSAFAAGAAPALGQERRAGLDDQTRLCVYADDGAPEPRRFVGPTRAGGARHHPSHRLPPPCSLHTGLLALAHVDHQAHPRERVR